MTDAELWNAIYAYNQRQKNLYRKLADLRNLLPAPGEILTAQEMTVLLSQLRAIARN